MATRSICGRSTARLSQRCCSASTRRSLATSTRRRAPEQPNSSASSTTHFGFETIPETQKESRVGAVFSSVASNYDTMNDLMSLGIHRLWKDYFVRSLAPGTPPNPNGPHAPWTILDIAGGTGDIAFRMLDHATTVHGDHGTRVIVSDINAAMLAEGEKRARATPYAPTDRLRFLEANAEDLGGAVASASVDLYTVAFGIRNFTHKDRALREAFRVLKPGGVFACLEFSKVAHPLLDALYKRWSFAAIPLIGQVVAADRDSYQYLVESIERFPSQQEFSDMIRNEGFEIPTPGWEDLTGGIAAIHRGVKPLDAK